MMGNAKIEDLKTLGPTIGHIPITYRIVAMGIDDMKQ